MTPRAYRNVVRRSVDDIWLVLRLVTSLRPYLVRRYSEHVSIDRGPIQSGSRNHKLSTVPGTTRTRLYGNRIRIGTLHWIFACSHVSSNILIRKIHEASNFRRRLIVLLHKCISTFN